MIILKKLIATDAANEPYTHPPCHRHTVGHDLGKGGLRTFALSPDAVSVSDGKTEVIIPLEQLVLLVEPHIQRSQAAPKKAK